MNESFTDKFTRASKPPLIAMALLFALLAATGHAHAAQNDPSIPTVNAKPPAYDVVSIKLNKSATGGFRINFHDDRFTATNVPLKLLLQLAYNIKEDLISGVSGPVAYEHFDIEAKVLGPDPNTPVKLSDKQLLAMLLPVFADRFQLRAHTEFKNLPIYELIVLKNGPKFKQTAAGIHSGNMQNKWSDNNREVTASGTSMANLAGMLADQLHRTTIDKTGLTGHYDFTLKWSSDVVSDPQADAGPSIFTAIQEQLGLKLQPSKGPVETLVVDHAEMPSPN